MTIQTTKVDPLKNPDAWHALRGRDVTASIAAALLGVHPYKTRYGLWMEKAGQHIEPVEETDAILRGKLLEPVAIELLKRERPTWRVWQPNIYLSDRDARMGATPDAYATDPDREGFGIVQVKSVERGIFKRTWFNDEGEVEPPLWIAIQAICEAHLAGASWAAVTPIVFDFGLKLEVIDVPIHAGVIQRLRDEVRGFWASIEANQPPPPDYGADAALLSAMYARDNGQTIDLSGDNLLPEILAERAEIKARVAADLKRANEIEAEIVDKLGEHERGFLPGWDIRRPTIQRAGYFVDATEYRRLTVRQVA